MTTSSQDSDTKTQGAEDSSDDITTETVPDDAKADSAATDYDTVPAADVFDLSSPVTTDDGTEVVMRDHALVRSILSEAREHFTSQSVDFAGPPSDAVIASDYFDFSFLDNQSVEEWQWVNRPHAFVVVVHDEEARERRYRVVEPALSPFEGFVRDDLVAVLRNNLLYREPPQDADRRERFKEEVADAVEKNAGEIDNGTLHKLMYYLVRNFIDYGRVDPIMRDPAIEDISCDGSDVPLFVYHRDYRDLQTNVVFEQARLNAFVSRLAQRAHRQLTVSEPLVDASLPDGSRVQLTLGGDVSTRGSNFTIRKFADIPLTPVDLIASNTFSAEQMAYFWVVIENNKSLIFAGGTGSGKTTSMNAVSFFIPPNSKVVSIEDTREVDLPHQNWIQSVSRTGTGGGRGEVSTYRLLQSALRQRPEYLIVGEIRTEERVALTFFQAMSTGHTAYTTVHADSVDSVIGRLQNPPLNVPVQLLADLDVICIQRQAHVGKQRVRRNISVAEVSPATADSVETEMIFERDADADSFDRVGDSSVLAEIARDRGWNQEELDEELALRQSILEYLLDHDIRSYEAVASAIRLFARDREWLESEVEAGTLTERDLLTESEHVSANPTPLSEISPSET